MSFTYGGEVMLIYVVKFPHNYKPRQIGYKTYDQAVRICGHFNLSRRSIKVLYFEEDENRISFGDWKDKK